MKFKVGDRVRILQQTNKGLTGTVMFYRTSEIYPYGVKLDQQGDNQAHGEKWNITHNGAICNDIELELLKTMPENIKYILSYDTPDRDPIEYFEKLSEVENRIEELTRQNGALLDTIKIYEVKAVGKVEGIKINITFKK